jgi:hypothetical protein
MPEHVDEIGEAFLAIGVDIHAGIVEKAGAGTQANAAVAHVVLDHVRRAIAIAAERALEIAAGVIEDVAAAPVDKLQ